MSETMILIKTGELGTLRKGQKELEVGGRAGTIQITTLVGSARILRRSPRTGGDPNERSWANAGVKKLQGIIIIIIIIVLKKQWNINVTVIPAVVGALGRVFKFLKQRLEELVIGERIDTIQTKAMLKLARMLRGVLESRGHLKSLRLQLKQVSKTCKKWNK